VGFVSIPPVTISGGSITIGGSLTSVGVVGKINTNVNVRGSLTTVTTIGTLTAGTVAISGTPSVNVSSGTVAISSGTVAISGSVNTVTSGTVSISGAVNMNVNAGQVIAVKNTGSGSLTVAGVVSITGSPAVTVTSGTVSITGTPAVTVSGTVSVSISSGSVSISSGQVSVQNATGTVIQVSDEMILLAHASQAVRAATFTITAPRHGFVFGCLLVELRYVGATAVTPYCAAVQVATNRYGASGTTGYPTKFVAPFGPASQGVYRALIPLASLATTTTSGTLSVTVYLSNSTGATFMAYAVYGLTNNPGVQLRSDCRAYPLGATPAGHFMASGTTGVIIAAPASPLRIMLRSATAISETAGLAYVTWTNTNTGIVVAATGTAGSNTVEFDSGLLLPPATALKIKRTVTGNAWGFVTYDLVV
jgi:hypothetical protein